MKLFLFGDSFGSFTRQSNTKLDMSKTADENTSWWLQLQKKLGCEKTVNFCLAGTSLDATQWKFDTELPNISKEDLKQVNSDLESGSVNPRDTKRTLARDIVSIYHDDSSALQAEQNFDKLFIKKKVPDDIPEVSLNGPCKLIEVMVSNGMVSSNGDAKRMVKQGAVKINDEKIFFIKKY